MYVNKYRVKQIFALAMVCLMMLVVLLANHVTAAKVMPTEAHSIKTQASTDNRDLLRVEGNQPHLTTQAAQVTSRSGSQNVVVFNDPTYVDNGSGINAESTNLQASLTSFGYTVQPFTGINASDFRKALEGQQVLVIPKLEGAGLGSALSSDAKRVIRDFVSNGGGLIIHATSQQQLDNFLQIVFGFDVTRFNTAETSLTKSANGTAFEGGPSTLSRNNTIHGLGKLPPDSKAIYTNNVDNATVAIMPYGNSGKVIYMGWDWDNAQPNGEQDGGWLDVLNRAVQEARIPRMADLSVGISSSPNPVKVGSELTYSVNITNNGPLEATGVTLTDPLPNAVEFRSVDSTQGSCLGNEDNTVSCDLGILASGATASVTIKVMTQEEGLISNTVQVSADQPDFDSSNNSATVITEPVTPTPVGNRPPEARNVTITPAEPRAGQALTLDYDFYDPDGDAEGETLIRWTREVELGNRESQIGLNKKKRVPDGITIMQERWCATVTPHDGQINGQSVERCVNIELEPNGLPQALDVTITPADPNEANTLRLTYDYSDTNGDPQDRERTELRWYRNGMLQSNFNKRSSVPSSATNVGETWCGAVRVHDGKQYGPITSSNCVIINPDGNTAPDVENTKINPENPQSGQPLELDYRYTDRNNDQEGMTQIRWYRDGILQPAFNDMRTVKAVYTLPGEMWHITVRPHDGEDYGVEAETNPVLIEASAINTPPEARRVRITPEEPGPDKALRLHYTYLDADGDHQHDTRIRWYKNRQRQHQYNGLTAIPASALRPGQVWHVEIIPHDGKAYGLTVPSESVRIAAQLGNTAPKALDVYLAPAKPSHEQNLDLHYIYRDDEEDPEGNTIIQWEADGTYQPLFEGETTIPANVTEVGQRWCVTITPHDGQVGGRPIESNCATIQSTAQNTPPVVSEAYLGTVHHRARALEDHLQVNYSYLDADGEPEGMTIIRWYKDGQPQKDYDRQTIVPTTATSEGQRWYAEITPHDGTEYGEAIRTEPVVINHRPQAKNARILPEEPIQTQVLRVDYDYTDGDDDPNSKPRIQWYKNNQLQEEYNEEFLPVSATSGGDRWHATIEAFDGYEYGPPAQTASVTISPLSRSVNLYLPAVLQAYSGPDSPFEENNISGLAYGPLAFDQVYQAHPNDLNDWYFFTLNETSSVKVELQNYNATGKLSIYKETFDEENELYEELIARDGPEAQVIPNQSDPSLLTDLAPGKYLIRIFSVRGTNKDQKYDLKVSLR